MAFLARLHHILILVVLLAGCSSPEADPEAPPQPQVEEPRVARIVDDVLVYYPGYLGNTGADVVCVFGGGIQLPRADGRVTNGTSVVEFVVNASASSGIQVGYVLDDTPRYDEVRQTNITWLPVVLPGQRATIDVPVPANGYEEPDGEALWHFYFRANLPGPAAPDCFTGAYLLDPSFLITAKP